MKSLLDLFCQLSIGYDGKILSCSSLKSLADARASTTFFASNKIKFFSSRSIRADRTSLLYKTIILLLLCSTTLVAQQQMENLDRGIVAVRTAPQEVFISWRLLGKDPSDVGFNIYRGGTLLNDTPILSPTHFTDTTFYNYSYTVVPVIQGVEQNAYGAATPWEATHLTVSLQRPAAGITPTGQAYDYSPNDCSVGDLDGDGDYEIIVKWEPSNAHDNSHAGYTGNVFIDAYTLEGEQLWRIDLGRNIRAGAHYTQFMVYDFDGDGKAELACKTADATIDALGNVIGDIDADYRSSEGYILNGPEFLTLFNGETGAAMVTTDYIPPRGNVTAWGDNYGNRVDRFLAGVAYLDGIHPSLIMCRGYYTRTVIAAWDWQNGELTQRWVFDTDQAFSSYEGQGAHSLTIGDVDGDGKDEITYGACAIDDNGEGLYNTELGHGDALHLSDMDPNRPGKEVYMVHETPSEYGIHGVEMRDAETGEILWSREGNGSDVGRGVAMDIDPNYPGYEAWGLAGGLVAANGEQISATRPSSVNFGAWWDGDLLRELLDGTRVRKWDFTNLAEMTILEGADQGAVSNNHTKSTPALSADILGDWREEIIWRHYENDKLLIFTSTIPTDHRLPTLMHDPQYRTAIAWQNVGYNQPPHPSYYLGSGMSYPDTSNITLVNAGSPALINLAVENLVAGNELNWFSSGTADDLKIYRNLDNTPQGSQLIAEIANSNSVFLDESVSFDTAYFYWIESIDMNGDTVLSNVVSSFSTRTNIDLTAEAFNAMAELEWEIIGEHSDIMEVYRDLDNDPADRVLIATLDGMDRSYSDENLTNGTTYYYWVETENDAEQIVTSNVANATPVNMIFFQEEALGFCNVEGSVDSDNSGFTGAGFANTDNELNTGIDYQITIGETGSYDIGTRYANGSNNPRPIKVLVNDEEKSILQGSSTGDWSNWDREANEIFFENGQYQLRLEAVTESGLPNIDYMSIAGINVEALSCDINVISDVLEINSEIKIYPNPTNNIFHIETKEVNIGFEIYHSSGVLVKKGWLIGSTKEVGASLPAGLYIIVLTSNNFKINKAIVKFN